VMPPFAGTEAERNALSAYLATLYPAGPRPSDGQRLFEQNCSVCHESAPTDPAITALRSLDPEKASESLKDLPALFVRMPDLKLSDQQRSALVQWIRTRFAVQQAPEQRAALTGRKGAN